MRNSDTTFGFTACGVCTTGTNTNISKSLDTERNQIKHLL